MGQNFLNGLGIPSFAALPPAAIQWRDTVANVRVHGETHSRPVELFAQEQPRLKPLPAMPYDGAVLRPISANGCCHILYDTNRYSLPHRYASQPLTLKLYPVRDPPAPRNARARATRPSPPAPSTLPDRVLPDTKTVFAGLQMANVVRSQGLEVHTQRGT